MSTNTAPRTYPLYRYEPSLAAAIVFCLLFCFLTLLHVYQMCRKRAWFLVPLVIGGFCEIAGYACRASSASSVPGQYRLMPFVVQASFILIAPALFAATIYMTFGRVLRLTDGDSRALLGSRIITRVFLGGDVFCFILQVSGGGLLAVEITSINSSQPQVGNYLVIAGITLQLIWFVFFVAVAALFQYRMRLNATMFVLGRPEIQWQRYLGSLYFTSALIVVRSVFRVAEYAEGYNGYIQGLEAFFYVFDSVPMLLVMVWMNWQHPGDLTTLLREKGLTISAAAQTPLSDLEGNKGKHARINDSSESV